MSLVSEAAPGSDLQNVGIEWLQQAQTPQEHAERVLALKAVQDSGMAGYNVPALLAQRDALADAEDAAMPYNQAGAVMGAANPVSLAPQSAGAATAPSQNTPSLLPTTSPANQGLGRSEDGATIQFTPIPHVSASGGVAPTTWVEGAWQGVKGAVKDAATNIDKVPLPPFVGGVAPLVAQLRSLYDASNGNTLQTANISSVPTANAKNQEQQQEQPDYQDLIKYSLAAANGDRATMRDMELNSSLARFNKPAPVQTVAAQESENQYIPGPISVTGGRNKTTNPADKTYGAYGLSKPLSQSSIGEVVKFQPKLRNHIQANKGPRTSAVGKYQIIEETLVRHAQRVFGDNWQNVIFNEANQDLLGQSIYEEARKYGSIPSKVWAGLEKYRGKKGYEWVDKKGGFREVSWETAQAALLPVESGAKPSPTSQQSQQTPAKPDYAALLPELEKEYLANADRVLNGGVPRDLQSFIAKGRDGRSVQQILNELGKDNSTIKTQDGTTYNTLAIDPNTFTHSANKVMAELGKQGIRVSPHQVVDVMLKNTHKVGGIFGDKDKLGVEIDVVVDRIKKLSKMSADPQVALAQQVEQSHLRAQAMKQQLEATNTELTKLTKQDKRFTSNAGSARKLAHLEKKRNELLEEYYKKMDGDVTLWKKMVSGIDG